MSSNQRKASDPNLVHSDPVFMINGSPGGTLMLDSPRTDLHEVRLLLIQTPLQLLILLGIHQLHLPEEMIPFFGPTGGPTSDPGLLRPGADLIGGEGTEDSSFKQSRITAGMGKPRGPGSRGHYGPWPTSQVPRPPNPPSLHRPNLQFSPPRQPAEGFFLLSPIG